MRRDGRALSLQAALRGKAARWGRPGKARPDPWDPHPPPAWNFPEPVSLSPSLAPSYFPSPGFVWRTPSTQHSPFLEIAVVG